MSSFRTWLMNSLPMKLPQSFLDWKRSFSYENLRPLRAKSVADLYKYIYKEKEAIAKGSYTAEICRCSRKSTKYLLKID